MEQENIQTTDQSVDTGEQKANEQQPKTYTQEEVTGYVAKEAKKAQEKLLKDLGVEDFKSAKEGLAKFKEYQESLKTDQQRNAELLQAKTSELEQSQLHNKQLQAQLAALKQGVKDDCLDDVLALAERSVTDDKDIDTAIGEVLEKYPQFKQTIEHVEQPKVPTFTVGGNPDGTGGKPNNPFQNIIDSYGK